MSASAFADMPSAFAADTSACLTPHNRLDSFSNVDTSKPHSPSATLPLFSHCRDDDCVEKVHRAFDDGAHVPDDTGAGERSGELGALPGASPMLPIAEVSCDDDADAAIRLAINAQRWSLPLVLRGCALSMPVSRT